MEEKTARTSIRCGTVAFVLFLAFALKMCDMNNETSVRLSETNARAAANGLRVRWSSGIPSANQYEPDVEAKK